MFNPVVQFLDWQLFLLLRNESNSLFCTILAQLFQSKNILACSMLIFLLWKQQGQVQQDFQMEKWDCSVLTFPLLSQIYKLEARTDLLKDPSPLTNVFFSPKKTSEAGHWRGGGDNSFLYYQKKSVSQVGSSQLFYFSASEKERWSLLTTNMAIPLWKELVKIEF